MNEQNELIFERPRCGDQCEVVFGCGFENDYIFCSCGYDRIIETSTTIGETVRRNEYSS